MTHLTPDEIVDVAEGTADAAPASHARDCHACRAEVEAVGEALRAARSDRLPEPSPLFWPHLAARIGEAVRRERIRAPFRAAWGAALAPLGAVAALVAAVAVGLRMWPAAPVNQAPAAAVEAPAAFDDPVARAEPEDDPSWILVSELSADVSVDDAEASGALPPPGGAEKALFQLDDAERLELARLLREAIEARSQGVLRGPGA
jgi:hypothetical protein